MKVSVVTMLLAALGAVAGEEMMMVNSTMNATMGNPMNSTMNATIDDTMNDTMNNTMDDAMNDTMDDTMDDTMEDTTDDEEMNVVDMLLSLRGFRTLTRALTSLNLTEVLVGEGPFTVFAPPNGAFKKLPNGTLESLSTEQLTSILLYHVVPGKFFATDLSDGMVPTASGENVTVDVKTNRAGEVRSVKVNSARVTRANIDASNGVVHKINRVLIPPSLAGPMDIVAVASERSALKTLVGALVTADLVSTLQGEGPFTVFAPTNKAFGKLPEGALDISVEALSEILLYHVVPGMVMSTDLTDGMYTSANGANITIDVRNRGGVLINNSTKVTQPDILTANGVIHIINGVLLP